jgi:hypothetical protein
VTERPASERYAHALSATITLQAVAHSLHAARNAVWEAGDAELRDDLQRFADAMLRLELRAFHLRDRLERELDAEQRDQAPKRPAPTCDTLSVDTNGSEYVCREPVGHAGPHIARRR